MPTIEDDLKLSNWLSILTFDVVKYAAANGEVVVEWTDGELVLRLPGVAAEQVHSKFRRLFLRPVDHADPPERVDDRATVEPVGIGQGVEHGGR